MALNVPYGCFAANILKSSKVLDFTLTDTLYPARLVQPGFTSNLWIMPKKASRS